MKNSNNNSEDPLSQAEPSIKASACCSLNQWLILAAAVVITAVVVGAGVFWLMNNRFASEQAALEQRIADLQSQAAQAQPASEVKSEVDTSNWKTYTNQELGYSVLYPINWPYTIGQYSRDSGVLVKTVNFKEVGRTYSIEEGSVEPISISTEENKNNLTPLGLANQATGGSAKIITNITISGQPAVQVKNYLGLVTYVTHNGKLYNLATPNFGSDEANQPIRDIYSQILSTFKFLDTAPVSTADWKTYQSANFPLTFKLPAGFDVFEQQAKDGFYKVIYIAKNKVEFYEIGSSNAFLTISEQKENNSRMFNDFRESTIIIDGKSAQKFEGDDYGRYEGSSAGRIMYVQFNNLLVEVEEKPAAKSQDFEVMKIADAIVSTLKFTK